MLELALDLRDDPPMELVAVLILIGTFAADRFLTSA